MKREVGVSIVAVLVIAAALLSVYYLGVGPTGQVILSQYINESSCIEAGYTWENLTEQDCSAETISAEEIGFITSSGYALTGENASNFFITQAWDITNESSPVLINEIDYFVDSTTGIVTNETVAEYSSVNFTYTYDTETCEEVLTGEGQCAAETVSVSITEPAGDYDSGENIPLTFTTTGENLECSYEITSDNGTLITDGELSGCASTTFDFSNYDEDENYIAIVSVIGPAGNASDSSEEFWVDIPGAETEEEIEEIEEEVPVEEPVFIPSAQISIGTVTTQEIIQGSSSETSLSVQNTGNVPLTSCALTGDDSGWVTVIGEANNMGSGAGADFSFIVNVPEETPVGEYTLSLSIACAETSGSTNLAVNVLQKKLDFNITNVQRTRDDRVSVDYILTELVGEDQDVEIFFSITDASGVTVGSVSQNRSIDANESDDFRTNIPINETLLPVNETSGEPVETDLTLSATFNSQIYSSSVLEPITIGAVTGGAIFGGVGAGSLVIVVVVVLIIAVVFLTARRMRKSKAAS